MLDIIFPPLHREGYRMLAIAVIITMLLILINKILGVIGVGPGRDETIVVKDLI